MGEEISKQDFSQEDFDEFQRRLRLETKVLMEWFKEENFETSNPPTCGLELEAWLVDQDFLPSPQNEIYLSKLNHPMVVSELSQFNFELNCDPLRLTGSVFEQLHQKMKDLWSRCQDKARELNIRSLMIGILPTLRNEMLDLKYLSSLKRYHALNRQILNFRNNKDLELHIQGKDELRVRHSDVMLEAAATSLQIHLQVNPLEAVRFYNASLILSAPMVALTANSPYLFGKDLWEETRIPTFEQAIDVASFRNAEGDKVGRVTFGTGYARHSLFELFLENLDGYPPLLPLVSPEDSRWLQHLRLHNGTIWRWNRPIVGLTKEGKPHLRLEHRVMPSGPSLADSIANMMFYLGCTHAYAQKLDPPENHLSFLQCRKNFYQAARQGLKASIVWERNKESNIQSLILDELLPQAKLALVELGVDKSTISYYLEDILRHRAMTGRTGATWQRAYISTHGDDFQGMTQAYWQWQQKDQPVHEWTV